MSTYQSTGTGSTLSSYSVDLSEQHLYGSSRLGIMSRSIDMKAAYTQEDIISFYRGYKQYELSNHLGNVLVTITDKKTGVSTNGTTIDNYTADVSSANDYYSGGMLMPGRQYNAESYSYGFNGKEKDNQIKGVGNQIAFESRIDDPRLGRFLSVDLLQQKYPDLTPYQFAGNNPIMMVDHNGLAIKLAGTEKNMNAFVSRIKLLTGLDIKVEANGNLKLISAGDPNSAISGKLRESVLDLIDEKSNNYNNSIAFKLVDGKKGSFFSKIFNRKITSDDVYIDNFYNGALDLQDLNTAKNNVAYSGILAHVIAERAYVKTATSGVLDYEGYINSLNNKATFDESDDRIFDNSHLAGKIAETDLLNEYVLDKNGKPFKLTVPTEAKDYDDLIKDEGGTFTRDYKGVKILIESERTNSRKVNSIEIKKTNPDLKTKNGAF